MTPAKLKHYLVHNATINGLTNTLANGACCYWLIKDKGTVTWWGHSNFGGDLIATAFILPFIVALIVIPIQRHKVAKGKATAPDSQLLPRSLQRFLALPSNLWARATIFGGMGVVTAALPTLLVFALVGIDSFTPSAYAIFKGLWAGALATILVLPMIVLGLLDTDTPSTETRSQ